jgi:hypothetical protein
VLFEHVQYPKQHCTQLFPMPCQLSELIHLFHHSSRIKRPPMRLTALHRFHGLSVHHAIDITLPDQIESPSLLLTPPSQRERHVRPSQHTYRVARLDRKPAKSDVALRRDENAATLTDIDNGIVKPRCIPAS